MKQNILMFGYDNLIKSTWDSVQHVYDFFRNLCWPTVDMSYTKFFYFISRRSLLVKTVGKLTEISPLYGETLNHIYHLGGA